MTRRRCVHPLAPLLTAAWSQLQRSIDAWRGDQVSVAALHDLRVAWRRLRVVLDLLKREPAPAAAAAAAKKAGRMLSRASSPIRDRDVLAAALDHWLANDAALMALHAPLKAQRDDCAAHFATQLQHDTPALQQAVDALQQALARGAAPTDQKAWQRGILRRCERRVERALCQCADTPDDAETWHALRIRCKQWRYTLELLEGDGNSKRLRKLRGLQQSLGEAQDAVTFLRLLDELAQPSLPPDTLLAIGRCQAMLHQQRDGAQKKARRQLKSLLAD